MKAMLTTAALAMTCVAVVTPTFAAQPTQDDFDLCNRAAQAAVSSPSASPQTSVGPGGATIPVTPTPGGAPGSALPPPPRTPESTAGVQAPRTPESTAGVPPPRALESTAGVQAGSGAGTTPTSTGGSSAALGGMLDRGMMDPAYKSAYQSCMKQRGF